MTVGSLFSGIGGIDLGLERVGMRIEWMVEIDPFCLKVLKKHWPEVPKYEDVKDFPPNDIVRPDVITGGFPCQDVSVAGKRSGLKGERSGLWFEMLRIVRELEPRWVLVENVPGLLSINSGGGFGTVLRDLAESGYDAEWDSISTSFFGGWHKRNRVFILAYPNGVRLVQDQFFKGSNYQECLGTWPPIATYGTYDLNGRTYPKLAPNLGMVDGVSNRVDRLRSLGNAVVPQVAEWIGRRILEVEN